MNAACLGCEGCGRSRLGPGYQGLGPLQAVPSDETCPYVLAQMSQDTEMHSLLLQQLGVWHLKWC